LAEVVKCKIKTIAYLVNLRVRTNAVLNGHQVTMQISTKEHQCRLNNVVKIDQLITTKMWWTGPNKRTKQRRVCPSQTHNYPYL